MKGTTKSGFAYEIDDAATDDMELFEAICEVDGGSMNAIPRVLTMLLGQEQKKALYDHLRGKNGRVKASDVFSELEDIFQGDESLKK